MRSLLVGILAIFSGLRTDTLRAQTYGEWPRECSLGLSPRFSAPFSHGVYFQGQEFLTNWASVDRTPPLRTTEWYEASPNPNPLSVDRKYRWDNARVEVECYVVRTPYYVSHAAAPTGHYGGTLRRVELACGEGGGGGFGGTETAIAPVTSASYDPYDPALSLADDGGEDCNSGSGGTTGTGTQYEPGDYTGGETVDWGTGQGNGGTSVCGNQAMVEYVCIDVYNGETGFWEEWGCGYVTIC